MNNKFLKELSIAYINDNSLEEDSDKLYEEIVEHREWLKKETPDVYDYLNESYQRQKEYFYSYLQESTALIIGTALTTALMLLGYSFSAGGGFQRVREAILSRIGNTIENILNKTSITEMRRLGAEYRVINRILEESYSNCVSQCGGNARNFRTLQLKQLMRQYSQYRRDQLDSETAACIANCSLDYLTSIIAELTKAYSICAEKNSEVTTTISRTTDSPLTDLTLDRGCQAIRTDIEGIMEEFNILLNIVYRNDAANKAQWIKVLDEKIKFVAQGRSVKDYEPLTKRGSNIIKY